MENLKNLEKIAKIFQPQNIITSEEIDQVLKGIMEILASYKKGTDAINEETKAVVNILLDKVVQSNKQTLDKAETVLDSRMGDLETLLKDVKQMCDDMEAMMSEVKDGKDADEEKIVEDVVGRIKIDPTIVTLSAEEVRDKLASLKDDARLDKSSIKGLEKILFQKDLDYAVATLQQQASFLINKGGVKSIVAGTNITVDNTDPSNPVVSASGGSGSGDVTGPASSTDNALVRFDGTTGKLIQNSTATLDDAGILSVASAIVSGTNGSGHINLRHQASDAVATGQSTAIFADSLGDFKWKNDGNFYTTLKTSSNTADRVYTFLNSSYNVLGSTTALTTGSILFANSSGLIAQDNSSLFFDDTNNRLGLLTTAPTHTLTLASTGTGIALYNTADQTTNYERVRQYWSGNIFNIFSESAGTGTLRRIWVGATVGRYLEFGFGSPMFTFVSGTTSGVKNIDISSTHNGSSGTQSIFSISSTINQSSTAGYTALLVNPTETTTGSGSKLLADFQVGGTSLVKITNTGALAVGSGLTPLSPIHLYQNTTDVGTAAGLTIEQAGTGDAVAQFLLSGVRRWVLGIDNSDSDTFKLSPSADLTNGIFSVTTGGAMYISSTIELGNASDTTLSRSSAGVLAVEGVVIPTISSTNTLTNKTISGTSNTLSNISFGSMTFLGCRVTQSAGQSITASTLTALAFDTESYDTDTMHDNVTNNTRVTFTTAGRYSICGAVTTDANAAVYGGVRLNGTTYIYKSGVGNAGASTANGINVSFDYNFSAADYIELMGTFSSTQNTKSGVDGCFITASRIG